MSRIVEAYWSAVARRLQEEINTFNQLIGHSGEMGKENELSLIRLLEKLLPSSVGIGSGMVIDASGNYSKQTDVIIYDIANQPQIMAQTNQVIFPIECVLLTIEVKTTLTEREIRDAVEKRASITALSSLRPNQGTPGLLLAYKAEGLPPATARQIRKYEDQQLPELICVIDPGLIAGTRALIQLTPGSEYIVGVVGLHEQTADGNRKPHAWQRPNNDEIGSSVFRGGLPFPVTRTSVRRDDSIIGEPGRALLIFCAVVMDLISVKLDLPKSVLSNYLQQPGRELFEI